MPTVIWVDGVGGSGTLSSLVLFLLIQQKAFRHFIQWVFPCCHVIDNVLAHVMDPLITKAGNLSGYTVFMYFMLLRQTELTIAG